MKFDLALILAFVVILIAGLIADHRYNTRIR